MALEPLDTGLLQCIRQTILSTVTAEGLPSPDITVEQTGRVVLAYRTGRDRVSVSIDVPRLFGAIHLEIVKAAIEKEPA